MFFPLIELFCGYGTPSLLKESLKKSQLLTECFPLESVLFNCISIFVVCVPLDTGRFFKSSTPCNKLKELQEVCTSLGLNGGGAKRKSLGRLSSYRRMLIPHTTTYSNDYKDLVQCWSLQNRRCQKTQLR